jgi:hypothetical protein
MNRVAAIAVCGLLLAGCETLSNLGVTGGGGGPTPVTLNLESDPSGADVTLSTGGSCRTPCALPVATAGDVTATFALANYQSRTITTKAVAAEKNFIGMESAPARFEPNPVYAELQPVPPKQQKRRPTTKGSQAAAKPASAQPAPARAPSGSSPSVAPAAPWPAPR